MWALIFAAGYSAHDGAIPRNANPFPRDNEQCYQVWQTGWDQSATNRQIVRWLASPLSKANADSKESLDLLLSDEVHPVEGTCLTPACVIDAPSVR
jgi:hypothetical protein